MSTTHVNTPYPPKTSDVPDEFEPDTLPVEPDEGPQPDYIPNDPAHDRILVPVLT